MLDSAFEDIVMPKIEGTTAADVSEKKRKRWVSVNCLPASFG